MENVNIWAACEECGSTRVAFTSGNDGLTEARCEQCGNSWEDLSDELFEEFEKDKNEYSR